jgi:hypothetical protein
MTRWRRRAESTGRAFPPSPPHRQLTLRVHERTYSIRHMNKAPFPSVPLRCAAACAIAATAVILAVVALSQPLPGSRAVWGGAALAAWCAALLTACTTRWRGTGLAQWKLGPWFLAWCAVAEGAAGMIWAPTPETISAQILPSSIARAEWLIAAAVTAWAAGYTCVPRITARAGARLMHHRALTRSTVRSLLTPWLLYAAGTAARIAFAVATGHLGYIGTPGQATGASWYQEFLADAGYACPLAILAAGLQAFREHVPGARLTLAVLLSAEIVSGAVMGTKGTFVTAFLAVAISRASAELPFPRKLAIAGAAVFILLVIPFTAAYRAAARDGTTVLTPAAAAQAAPVVASATAAGTGTGVVSASAAYLGQRLSEIGATAVVMQDTPSRIPYTSPAAIPQQVAAGLVPRVLWPGKPVNTQGYIFSQEYYGTPAGVYTSDAVTPQADLWRYGGWLPVLAGMALLGSLVRAADEVLDIRDPRAAMLVLMLWPVLATPEGSFTSILITLPGLAVTWFALSSAAFRRAARPAPALPRGARAPVASFS